MYILVVRKNKKVIFQKEYKTFSDLMKKFDEIDFGKEELLYNIYKNMSIKEILHEYLGNDDEMQTLKDLIKDL